MHAKVAGFLKSISVDVGDRVRAGQLLAVLEVPELQDEIRQDEAVREARRRGNQSCAGRSRTRPSRRTTSRTSPPTGWTSVMKARPNLVAQQDIDEASGPRPRGRGAGGHGAGGARVAPGTSSRSRRPRAARRRRCSTTRASPRPFAGVITHRYADTGAMIQAGTSSQTQAMPVVRLSENDRLRLVIPVPESAVSRIHLGSPRRRHGAVAAQDRVTARSRVSPIASTPTPGRCGSKSTCRTRICELVPGHVCRRHAVLDQASSDAIVAPVQAVDRSRRRAHACSSSDATARLEIAERDTRARDRRPRRGDDGAVARATWSSSAAGRSSSRARSSTPKLAAPAAIGENADVALFAPQPVLHHRRLPDRDRRRPDEPRADAGRSVSRHQHPAGRVATFYNGMPPEQIETDITGRFERFFTLGSGIDHMESRSLPGREHHPRVLPAGHERGLRRHRRSRTWRWPTCGGCRRARCRRSCRSSTRRACRSRSSRSRARG